MIVFGLEALSELACLAEADEAALGIDDEAAVTALLQQPSGLGDAGGLVLTALRGGGAAIGQEQHHGQALGHTTPLGIEVLRRTLYGQPQGRAPARTYILHQLRRALGAILRGYDVSGTPIKVAARGWLARIFQHEYDHLRGTLYVDRLEEPYGQMAAQLAGSKGWGRPGYTWTPGERA